MLRDGAVWCWGANESGQLGRGTRTARELPARAEGLEGAQALVAGGTTLFARRDGAWLGAAMVDAVASSCTQGVGVSSRTFNPKRQPWSNTWS